ncbi:MAG: TonB-dependent receptor [Ahniella sp.]|nr:TonB-dependent receptor [Ahniella sp.]
MTKTHHRTSLVLAILAVLPAAQACDLQRAVPAPSGQARLLEVAARIADQSDCRITLAPELARRANTVKVANNTPAADMLDALSVDYDLDWREESDGSITLLAYHDTASADLQSEDLEIEADADRRPVPEPSRPALGTDLPSERGPVVPRTELGTERVEDEALRDYTTAIMRAPGVYSMAATDSIRGISAPRLPVGYRASLVSIDGIPLPAEVNYFGQFDMNLTESMSIIRAGTGLGLAFGAGAGHIAVRTAEPENEASLDTRLLASSDFAPRASASWRWDYGVPGLRTAIAASGQLEDETFDNDREPDVFEDDQVSIRWGWDSPEGTHMLSGSALALNNAQIGGARTPAGTCGAGIEYCPAGADIAASGASLNYAWVVSDGLVLSAHGTLSDSTAGVTRFLNNEFRRSQPVDVQMRYADVRADWSIDDQHAVSFGTAYSSRRRQVSNIQQYLVDEFSESLGIGPLNPDELSLISWQRLNERVYQLPQVFAEWRFDDGERWDVSVGARHIATRSYIGDRLDNFVAENCQVLPGAPQGQDCVSLFLERGLPDNGRSEADRSIVLGHASLRWRANADHWLAVAFRQSFGISDYFAGAAPNGAVERIDTLELAWHVPIGMDSQLETRVFRHDWDQRTRTVTGSPVVVFDSTILGLETEFLWQPDIHAEFWANASVLETDTSLEQDDLVGAPKWSLGFGGRWRFDHGFYVGAHFSHVAEARATTADGVFVSLPERDLLDARVGWRNQAFDVSVFGTNLLDDQYVIDLEGRSFLPEIYEAPDGMLGVDIAWKW